MTTKNTRCNKRNGVERTTTTTTTAASTSRLRGCYETRLRLFSLFPSLCFFVIFVLSCLLVFFSLCRFPVKKCTACLPLLPRPALSTFPSFSCLIFLLLLLLLFFLVRRSSSFCFNCFSLLFSLFLFLSSIFLCFLQCTYLKTKFPSLALFLKMSP